MELFSCLLNWQSFLGKFVTQVTNMQQLIVQQLSTRHILPFASRFAMDSSKVKNGVAGLLTEKPLLPRVIDFVKASDAGPQKAIDVEDEPPQPQYYLFSRERFLALFEEANPRRNGRGLQNLGNTCFFNSVLQVLMHTAPLQKFLLSKQHTSECKCKKEGTVCTLCLLEQHAVEAFDSSHQPLKPVRLLKHMPQIANRFKSRGRQEDAHEFLIHFLDACLLNV